MGRINIHDLVQKSVVFTTSQNWTVPNGVYKIKILAYSGGGGGGGGYSSTYTGGGGGAGGAIYAEIAVTPGSTVSVGVGAGGSGGTGGASPTAGSSGGNTLINVSGVGTLGAWGGGGGGAATSSANGSNGGGGSGINPNMAPGTSAAILSIYSIAGAGGNGTSVATPSLFSPTFSGSSNIVIFGGTPSQTIGEGGGGGAVNSNGQAGGPGLVVIWWD
jgi:hypothetical protein